MKLFLKNLLFTLLIPGTVGGFVPLWIAHRRNITFSFIPLLLGAMLIAAGCAMYLWTVWDFAFVGRGTPLPIDAPKKLIVRGLYRYVRNPMYLGVLTVILGWAVLFSDGWLLVYALGIGLAVHSFVIFYEEPKLHQLFGSEYISYCQEVKRWLPNIPPKS